MCSCNFFRYHNLPLLLLPQFDIIMDTKTSLRLLRLLGTKSNVGIVESFIFFKAIVLPYGTGISDSYLKKSFERTSES